MIENLQIFLQQNGFNTTSEEILNDTFIIERFARYSLLISCLFLIPLAFIYAGISLLLNDRLNVSEDDYYGPVDHALIKFQRCFGRNICCYRLSLFLLAILGIAAISPGIIVGPLAINAVVEKSRGCLQAAIIWAIFSIIASFLVGFFGGYSINFLRSKEDHFADNDEEAKSKMKILRTMFEKIQDQENTIKYTIIMMLPRIFEIVLIIYSWKFAFGKISELLPISSKSSVKLFQKE
ncbi:unnamed protein product [Oikopleura dioica]|uniref:Transmembrane protein n=1 Tax=Oikopleura dioica TaxID=34765 RepID=E4X646_OIKDI|nr:unnamed protein product [Oikopleura dioica]